MMEELFFALITFYIIAIFIFFPYRDHWMMMFLYLFLIITFPVLGLIVYRLIFR